MELIDNDYFDVVIVGAGLSGIGAACMLRQRCPEKTVLVLEARERLGGTWDLFRYPGVRSDSDMHTLGYIFKPWLASDAIADGPAILAYINEAAAEHRISERIAYSAKLTAADWSTPQAEWSLSVATAAGERQVRCNMLSMCSGYYRYESGYQAIFDGRDAFAGDIIHPQFWPEAYDYEGKRVVVIGSGATAVTLIPELAKTAESVVMLQRSPTYIVSGPRRDRIGNILKRILPEKTAYALTRLKNTWLHQYFYGLTRTVPERVKASLLGRVRKELGPDYDIDTHFTPRYNPWDQRVCLVPDGDFFAAIREQRATVVTDEIACFTASGVSLKSGKQLPADLIVTATGLELEVLGGAELSVDGVAVDVAKTITYKGMMYSGVPNLQSTFGYINSSWTLRADLNAEYLCRLIQTMDEAGHRQVVPRLSAAAQNMSLRPWIDGFTPGYLKRSFHKLPKQGDAEPWINPQAYRRDRKLILKAPVEDGVLAFS